MAEKTTTLNLYKRNIDDPVSLSYFNDNMDTIDEILGVLPRRLNLLTADVRDNTNDIVDLKSGLATEKNRIDDIEEQIQTDGIAPEGSIGDTVKNAIENLSANSN